MSNSHENPVTVVESPQYERDRQVYGAVIAVDKIVGEYYPVQPLPQYVANNNAASNPVNPVETAAAGMPRVDQLLQDLYRP